MATKKIPHHILSILERSTYKGDKLWLPSRQLDQKTYQSVAKVLIDLGGKWNKTLRCHIFQEDAEDRIEQAILSGTIDQAPKNPFEFFPTPKDVVKLMLKKIDHRIDGKIDVLEPSAGRGSLIQDLPSSANVTLIELMRSNHQFLTEKFPQHTLYAADFLDVAPTPSFDVVIMNPPFSKGKDAKHIMHAHKFLCAGGDLVAIASSGVMFRETSTFVEFRQYVKSYGGTIEELPDQAFKTSGTNVATVLVWIPADLAAPKKIPMPPVIGDPIDVIGGSSSVIQPKVKVFAEVEIRAAAKQPFLWAPVDYTNEDPPSKRLMEMRSWIKAKMAGLFM